MSENTFFRATNVLQNLFCSAKIIIIKYCALVL